MAAPVAAPAADTVEGADGAPLALSRWAPDGPARALLLAVHGFGDYGASAFEEAATFWAAQGVEVWAYDQRGFGRNASRGAWPGAGALIGDFAAVARQARAARPGLPIVALGHSMGGGVVLAAVGEGRAPQVDRVILAAPAIAGGAAIPPLARAFAWGAAGLAPDRRLTGEGLVRVRASDNLDALRRLRDDPVYLRGASPREIAGLIRVMDRAAAAAPGVAAPVLLLLGEKDAVTPPAPAARAAAAIAGPVTQVRYRDGWHLLLRDLARQTVWRDVAAFTLSTERLPAR